MSGTSCIHSRAVCARGGRACTASTTMLAKKSDSESTILEDSAVLAQLISVSLPSVSVLMARCSSINLHACQKRKFIAQLLSTITFQWMCLLEAA